MEAAATNQSMFTFSIQPSNVLPPESNWPLSVTVCRAFQRQQTGYSVQSETHLQPSGRAKAAEAGSQLLDLRDSSPVAPAAPAKEFWQVYLTY